MARGKKCPCCETPLYAQDERYHPAGTEVVYVCRNRGCEKCGRSLHTPTGKAPCTHREKLFEDNR